MLRTKLQNWLGITDLSQEIKGLGYDLYAMKDNLRLANDTTTTHNAALARIIAKLDPAYGRDMSDPTVRAESKTLEDRILKTLLGDHKFSNRY